MTRDRMTTMSVSFWTLATVILFSEILVEAPRPFLNHPTCPRDPGLARERHCSKKCHVDDDCKGKRQCLCDPPCGTVCVKPRKPCPEPEPITNGHVILTTAPTKRGNYTFGARVRYTCLEGFILSGISESVCRGDGQWSGVMPTCQTEARCRTPPWVPHAIHKGPVGRGFFPLGAHLMYDCEAGYNMQGYSRARCIGEGRWVGPRMTCTPVRCGHPGNIANANRQGNVFVYPFQVTYVCRDGYRMLADRPTDTRIRRCLSNGQWSGTPATCIPIKCPRLSRPVHGTMIGSDNTYGGIIHFYCDEGFKMTGFSTRKCRMDGAWSGRDVKCDIVDCGTPGPIYNGYLDIQGTTYKSIITFKCNGLTTFEGLGIETKCQQNGTWSIAVPKCWKKCKVPVISDEAMAPDTYMDHGLNLKYACPEGRESNTTEDPVCHNGSWTIPPVCVPASCKIRPQEIRDGHVRFYTTNHGDRARYKCNTGYFLQGREFVTCQFGKWLGQTPMCSPVFCEHPGYIENGQILLVGVLGKYEYRTYVKDITHNQEIEYHCNKEYKRVGPGAATCVGGKWSPANLPRCVWKSHPKILYIFRGKRSIDSRQSTVQDMDEKGLCEVPRISGGKPDSLPEGYYVPHNTVLKVTCDKGLSVALGQGDSTCNDGVWTWLPGCLPDT